MEHHNTWEQIILTRCTSKHQQVTTTANTNNTCLTLQRPAGSVHGAECVCVDLTHWQRQTNPLQAIQSHQHYTVALYSFTHTATAGHLTTEKKATERAKSGSGFASPTLSEEDVASFMVDSGLRWYSLKSMSSDSSCFSTRAWVQF